MKSSKYPFVHRCKALLITLAFVALGRPSSAQVNDLCAGAVNLTSNLASCVTTAGTIATTSTYTAFGSACNTARDVWYTFTAQSVNPTITVTGALTNPRIQVLSGGCLGLTSFGCSGSGTYNPIGLTIGTVYLIRVYSQSNGTGNFNICISDPTPPANDLCSNATNLSSSTSCSTTSGTLLSATQTTGVPGDCGAAGASDVWYKFTANSGYPTITLGSVGVTLAAAGMRIQLLSGACGSMTSLACVAGNVLSTYGQIPGPLTVGTTYYIRIYTNTYPLNFAAQTFTICVTDLNAPTVEYGKSYVNITKGASGGTIEPGDVLEVRAVFTLKAGTTLGTSFYDNIPSNTTYIPGTLRVLTNEGQLYKQWTDAADGDPGTISGTSVTINMGTGATQTIGGTVNYTDRPTVFGSTCVMVVSYRVTVGAVPYSSIVPIGNGGFIYVNPSGVTKNIAFPAVSAKLTKNFGICANTVGGNGILSEFGGTFGTGNLKDRGPSSRLPNNYTYIKFSSGSPGDYYYGVSNNTSPGGANYSTNPNDGNSAHHVFSVWDIIGDHTGAASPTAGNSPGDTTGGKKAGYMIVINASYRADTAFLDTVRNLCPNTYYEYSAWFRNICKKCSGDSTGKSPGTAGYVPTGPGDSSGVHPNLTFNINGYDYYTTGDMSYTGQWVKKGFSYLTGPGETQMVISIRNNAPGGGGNDWAIDDIGVATCSPNLDITPSTPQVNVCYGDGASLSANVQSYFDNYTEYIWEKSLDSGATWVPTGFAGPGVPVYDGTQYTYTAVGPSFIGDSSTNKNIFRLRVASSPGNIVDTSCSFSGLRTVVVYVHNCMWVLKADLLGASANMRDNYGLVQWQTTNETTNTSFVIERSYDGTNFTAIANIKAHGVNGNGSYSYTDPTALNGTTFYRVKLVDESTFKYSKVFMLSPGRVNFAVQNLINPFVSSVSCNVIIPADGDMRSTIFDMYGRVIKMDKTPVTKGIVPLKIQDLGSLSAGTYFLKVEWQNQSIIRKIVKTN